MRYLVALLALALGLAACDDSSTTAPVADVIPGPPNAPRLTMTVLTGTKAAPVDSPMVKFAWAYKSDSIQITYLTGESMNKIDTMKSKIMRNVGDTSIKFSCKNGSFSNVYGAAYYGYATAVDSAKIYCK